MINFWPKKQNNLKNRNGGFTLIEMLVAVFVFGVVMTIAIGAIFTLVSANKSSQATKSVLDNLNGALDSMTSAIRYGSNYRCDINNINDGLPLTGFASARSCTDGATSFTFLSKDGFQISYQLFTNIDGHKSVQSKTCNDSGCGGFIDLTASEVNVKNLVFYVTGASLTDPAESYFQPRVLMTISGEVKSGSNTSAFNVETMVTQRNPVCKQFMQPKICVNP